MLRWLPETVCITCDLDETDLDRVADAYDLHSMTDRLEDDDGGIEPAEWDAVAPDEPHPSERDE